MEIFQTKFVEKIETYIVRSVNYPRKPYRVCGRVGKCGTAGQATHDNLCIACWIPKGTNINSEYVLLFAVPLQEWLRERASMLRYR